MRALVLATLLGSAFLAACGARGGLDDFPTSSTSASVSSSGSGSCVPSPEVCNGVDDDCNGVIDDGDVCLGCPTASHGGHVYLFCQDHRSWPDALAVCQSAAMSLLSINDASEEAWVYAVEDGLSTEKAWMGLTDQAVEGAFLWASGDPVTYTDWESAEPNGGTGENCGQINRFYPDHGWNDEPGGEGLHFICESL